MLSSTLMVPSSGGREPSGREVHVLGVVEHLDAVVERDRGLARTRSFSCSTMTVALGSRYFHSVPSGRVKPPICQVGSIPVMIERKFP